ncbi:hypothetical protein OQX61_06340 [Pedobacter sp. PLR]|uniref:hypothetical protein n=1 Tax=Pedobacter sp. PLR TaxID=2994465 RepID=UPI002247B0BF|nr:hypothetical protein [Pedobacter sp. PLR]MCX2450890.1 hypothetical protein [Pedobacter sp. PLR]
MALATIALSACEKDESIKKDSKEIAIEKIDAVSEASLLKFLSISLDVDIEEINYDKSNNEYIIRGNKFNKTEMEKIYLDANIYHKEYGK